MSCNDQIELPQASQHKGLPGSIYNLMKGKMKLNVWFYSSPKYNANWTIHRSPAFSYPSPLPFSILLKWKVKIVISHLYWNFKSEEDTKNFIDSKPPTPELFQHISDEIYSIYLFYISNRTIQSEFIHRRLLTLAVLYLLQVLDNFYMKYPRLPAIPIIL